MPLVYYIPLDLLQVGHYLIQDLLQIAKRVSEHTLRQSVSCSQRAGISGGPGASVVVEGGLCFLRVLAAPCSLLDTGEM